LGALKTLVQFLELLLMFGASIAQRRRISMESAQLSYFTAEAL
jgi:hypothetical protein